MKIKFKSAWHRKTFTEFITANVKNPYLSRNEYIAAVFLLSADKFLWKRARRALTGYSVNFSSLNLSGISTEGYALFMTAKAIYRGDVDILNSYFGYTIHNLRGKPTNSEFIAMIADKIRLRYKGSNFTLA